MLEHPDSEVSVDPRDLLGPPDLLDKLDNKARLALRAILVSLDSRVFLDNPAPLVRADPPVWLVLLVPPARPALKENEVSKVSLVRLDSLDSEDPLEREGPEALWER